LIVSPEGSGKTTTIVLNVIQQLAGKTEESPRALIIVEDKEKVLAMEELLKSMENILILKFTVYTIKVTWITIKIMFLQELMF
jgi:superfamily II DNA/RNA helicase